MEHYQFADRVLTLCKEAKTEKLTAVLGSLETAVAEEDKALNQPRTEPNTQKMREADERRDRSYQALRLAVALHLHSTDAPTLAAAEAVNRVMEAYPNVTASNYDKETGLIRNLVADLGTDDVAQHVTKIDADLYVNRLEMDNTVFDKLFHAQLKTAATDRALSAVLRRVEALDELEPSA
ncbi:hemagglutinin protein HagC, partial [Prevotella dentalis DSM 3688]